MESAAALNPTLTSKPPRSGFVHKTPVLADSPDERWFLLHPEYAGRGQSPIGSLLSPPLGPFRNLPNGSIPRRPPGGYTYPATPD